MRAPVGPDDQPQEPPKQHSKVETTRRLYRPVDVSSWSDGFRVTIGWVLWFSLAIVIGGLSPLYEKIIINVEDRDLRDLEFDFRVTINSANFYHQYFVNGITCCNQDIIPPATLPATCGTAGGVVLEGGGPPFCPAIITFECYILTDNNCNQLRSIVYSTMGLSPSGAYSDCVAGGRMRVGSSLVPIGRPTSLTVTNYAGQQLGTQYLYDIFNINNATQQQGIETFIVAAIAAYGTTDFILPATPLAQALLVDGQPATLAVHDGGNTSGIKRINPWPTAIFDWPGMNKRCPGTGSGNLYYLEGTVDAFNVSDFDYTRAETMVSTLSLFNSTAQFAQWQVALAASGNVVGAPGLSNVTVSQIQSVGVSIGMVAAVGPCYGWLIETASVSATYGPALYNGPASGLTTAALQGGVISLNVTVKDVSAPVPLTLPPYYGMWYIVVSFLMAAFWIFPCGLFILIGIPLIWWNVRSNQGLAPLVYRYMRRYRGW